ncbi:Uncharacterized protein HDE_08199 [Halotydeus destructor]|nr:Uncharacterized protein HDE_08199 [Halotydeus destructor]
MEVVSYTEQQQHLKENDSSSVRSACAVNAMSTANCNPVQQSRFKVVKIDKKTHFGEGGKYELGRTTYKRGRWSVADYYSPEHTVNDHLQVLTSGQGQQGQGTPLQQIQNTSGQGNGQNVAQSSPPSGSHSDAITERADIKENASNYSHENQENQVRDHKAEKSKPIPRPLPQLSITLAQSCDTSPMSSPSSGLSTIPSSNENTLQSSAGRGTPSNHATHKNYHAVAASIVSTVAIDNKIEAAMDLVKSHLMSAVREEVDILQDKIFELFELVHILEQENTMLKAHVPSEVLSSLNFSPHPSPAPFLPSRPSTQNSHHHYFSQPATPVSRNLSASTPPTPLPKSSSSANYHKNQVDHNDHQDP